ncbi:MAG: hydrogenase 3 maturation endopeptidase HyCI [Candidatus Omnitrophota bacterium]
MKKELKDILKGKVVIVGIGNVLKGDDGFGPALIERLNTTGVDATCIDAGTSLENYFGKIAKEDPDVILIVDAAHLELNPGECAILESEDILRSGLTTHDISPKMFIDYLKDHTRASVYMLGVQPESISLGDEMSATLGRSLGNIAKDMEEILNARDTSDRTHN